MDDPDLKLLVPIVLVLIAAGAGWYFRHDLLPKPEESAATVIESTPVESPVESPADTGPRHLVVPYEPEETDPVDLVPLPALDDSDGYFLATIVGVFGTAIEPLLFKDAVIDRFVATIDNLPRDHVAEKIRPVGRLSETFSVDSTGNDGPVYLSSENYHRHDELIRQIASAEVDTIIDTYRRFYPLLQESYERLGYPNAYFNDRVIEVIDHLLLTPDIDEPIRLVRPHVLYQYADPELEALSSGQKLLLRMGNEHAAEAKRMLRELREQLAQQ
ncbi:MAG: DUF3014 domain-containing protein [Woeseiaceae bacterium]